ncbi:hypothetical protein F5051DRAFT_197062 [Lentinula edodes]|nr:hypothetical protein F5051DRAFT_197062 [Lentinula edodes]
MTPPVPPLPTQNAPLDPLNASAVSHEDKVLLNTVRRKVDNICMELCTHCHEKWFDLNVDQNGKCSKCQLNAKYKPSNNMYPGVPPELPQLTQMEEMLISPVHALVQVWQVRGGQYKYTGHTCNFSREVSSFHAKVPLLPQDIDILILRCKSPGSDVNLAQTEDFRVR